nr:iron ABC transporter permease [uncultured Butyrivibrio sp.]
MITGLLLLIAGSLFAMLFGNSSVGTKELLDALMGNGQSGSATSIIMFDIRIPRLLAAIACGAALALSGLLMQEALGNPLASPSIMGVNNGAGFFVLLSVVIFGHSLTARTIMSFAGAVASAGLVFVTSQMAGSSKNILILSGVAVSALMSAGINFCITVWPDTVYDKTAFQIGSLQGIQANSLVVTIAVVLIAAVFSLLISSKIELFALGDEVAFGVGLPVKTYRLLTILAAVVLAATVVSVCGLISFVGLIVPNAIKRIDSSSFKSRMLLTMIWGSNLLLFGDLLAKNISYPYELPVGMLISLIGAPFFIILLARRHRGQRG